MLKIKLVRVVIFEKKRHTQNKCFLIYFLKEKETFVKEKAIHLVFKFYLFFCNFFVFIYLSLRMNLAQGRNRKKEKSTQTHSQKNNVKHESDREKEKI